jgi:PAS domain S-box-containing protein
MREKLIGLGETSIRKSDFPELQQRLAEPERFKALLDQSNDAIFLVEITSMYIAYINESACQLLGYPRSILLSMPFCNIADISKSKFANEISRTREQVRTENQETLTTVLYKSDGNKIPAEITVRLAVLDEEVYLVAVVRDINKRKLAEEELSKQREQLEEKVLERDIQLSETNAELSKEIGVCRQAETRLQEANQKMATWISKLEERTAEMSQLIAMGEQLQSCQTVEEACIISARYIQKLFPAKQGALYLINPAKDLAEAVQMWGDSASTEKMFMPLNCCALQHGRPHLVDDFHPGQLCGHITGPVKPENAGDLASAGDPGYAYRPLQPALYGRITGQRAEPGREGEKTGGGDHV